MKVTQHHISAVDAALRLAAKAVVNTTNTKILAEYRRHGFRLLEIRKALFHGLSQPKFDFADASA